MEFICIFFLFLQGGMCTLFLLAEDRTVTITSDRLAPVKPQQNDIVKVIKGKKDKDQTGRLVSIDHVEGVVSFSNGELNMCPMDFLCKMSAGSQ